MHVTYLLLLALLAHRKVAHHSMCVYMPTAFVAHICLCGYESFACSMLEFDHKMLAAHRHHFCKGSNDAGSVSAMLRYSYDITYLGNKVNLLGH